MGAQATGHKLLTIFLSYASADRERVRSIVDGLTNADMSVWWDRKIPAGETYSVVIGEQLKQADVVVVIWSRDSIASEWVQAEADRGKRRDVLIPVLLDDVADDLPLGFALLQAVDFRAWNKRSDAPEVTELVAAVKALVAGSEQEEQEEQVRPPERTLLSRLARRRTLIVGGIALVALLSLAVAIIALRDDPSPPSETVSSPPIEDGPTTTTASFEDDFSSDEYGWPDVGAGLVGGRYANDAYQILAERGSDRSGVLVSPANAPTTENVRIDVEAERIGGSATVGYGYGIFCRAADGLDDLYRFTVWINHAVIQKRLDGDWKPLTADVPVGDAVVKELQARCVTTSRGDAVDLEFSVDGVELRATDPEPLETGTYGLHAVLGRNGEIGETLEVQFDNFAAGPDRGAPRRR